MKKQQTKNWNVWMYTCKAKWFNSKSNSKILEIEKQQEIIFFKSLIGDLQRKVG